MSVLKVLLLVAAALMPAVAAAQTSGSYRPLDVSNLRAHSTGTVVQDINNVIYVSPYSATNPSGVHTDCSVDASAAINAATAGGLVRVILPPGCIGVSSNVLLQSASGILEGSGIGITTIKAIGTMSSVVLGPTTATFGTGWQISNLTIDANKLATQALYDPLADNWRLTFVEAKNGTTNDIQIGDGVSSRQPAGIRFYTVFTSSDTTLFTAPSQLPNYNVVINATDSRFYDLQAVNAKVSNIIEATDSSTNQFYATHVYGYPVDSGNNYSAQYGILAGGFQDLWEGWQVDGATTAEMLISAWGQHIHNGIGQWAYDSHGNPTAGSAQGIQIASGIGDLDLTNNFIAPVGDGGVTAANMVVQLGSANTFSAVVRLNGEATYTDAVAQIINGPLTVNNTASITGASTLAGVSLTSLTIPTYLQFGTSNGTAFETYAGAGSTSHLALNASASGTPTLTCAGATNCTLAIYGAGTGHVSTSSPADFYAALTFQNGNSGNGTLTLAEPGTYGGAFALTTSLSNPLTLNGSNIVTASLMPLTGTTGSIGGGSLAAGACATGTVAVTGATTSMAVEVSPAGSTNPGAATYWRGRVSSAGTVSVDVCAVVASTTPVATTYNVRVIQ